MITTEPLADLERYRADLPPESKPETIPRDLPFRLFLYSLSFSGAKAADARRTLRRELCRPGFVFVNLCLVIGLPPRTVVFLETNVRLNAPNGAPP